MIYYSSVLIALINGCVNFVEGSTICCRFAPSPGVLEGLCLWVVPEMETAPGGKRMNHQWPLPALGISNIQQSGKEDAAP